MGLQNFRTCVTIQCKPVQPNLKFYYINFLNIKQREMSKALKLHDVFKLDIRNLNSSSPNYQIIKKKKCSQLCNMAEKYCC